MGYEPHVVPGVPSYTPLEKDRGLRAGAAEELALGVAEPRLDDRWVVGSGYAWVFFPYT